MTADSTGARTLGYVAGTLTALAFVPQVIRSWRTRSTGDFSVAMLFAFAGGVSLWLVYGLILGEPPIIASNGFTLAMALVLLWVKFRGSISSRKP
jgi:MtN3 and saliva related transmembrane protein